MKKTVYLAGPITGESYAGCTDWREAARKELAPHIAGLSPMRAKDYLENEGMVGHAYEDTALSSARGIMTRDFFDVRNCDVLLANLLGAERVSIGTVMEIAWAHAFRTPVVLVIEPAVLEHFQQLPPTDANVHEHAMIREAAGFRVETLAEGLEVCKAILTDYDVQ